MRTPWLLLTLFLCACGSGGSVSVGLPDDKAPDVRFVDAFPALRFQAPTALVFAPNDGSRLFVAEQAGLIRVVSTTPGAGVAPTFLDLRDRVSAGGELGLLGLAFDPGFPATGRVYVNYTADNPLRTVISRFNATADVADPASETVLLTYDQPFSNHNGGALAFGPDGMLYIASGDGGSANDPLNNGQSLTTPLGKILRIRPDGTIPPDNPFVANTNPLVRDEIWAYGLRNPWRMSFDRGTGNLWAGDVGQSAREEIDNVVKGGNYGWRPCEGTQCTGLAPQGHIPPVFEYDRSVGTTIIGGYVYRGSAIAGLAGRYLYADFGSSRVWALALDGIAAAGNDELGTVESPSTFGEDPAGELYVASYGGAIFRIAPQ